jgi:hypothetical protein
MNGTMNEVSSSGSASPAGDASASAAHSLSAANLLEVWERGQHQVHVEKALTLLAAAYPNASRETLVTLSIGQRDAGLIALRERLFGAQLTSLTDCPACGERLELSFNVLDIRTSSEAEPDATLSFSRSGYELQLRLPNSLDLLVLTGCSSPAEMRAKLFEQCVLRITHQGRIKSAEHLKEMPAEIVELAIERIGEADPQADVEVNLTCPCCQHVWQTGFDIVSYLWTELHTWAAQLLREVHLLASTYGWRESDILSMSPWRRRCYLEMLVG